MTFMKNLELKPTEENIYKTIDEDISFINRDKRIKHIESTKLLIKRYIVKN